MSEQLLLPAMTPSTPMGPDRVFFAIVPETHAATRSGRLAELLRFKHNLIGKPLGLDRFHVSLAHLGDFNGVPPDFVESAGKAASAVASRLAPFEVRFDHAMSFRRKSGRRPLVLLQENENPFMKTLLRELLIALGICRRGYDVDFIPHMTLLYDETGVGKEHIDPIGWTVNEIVLIHSLVGQSRHIPLGRWPLKG